MPLAITVIDDFVAGSVLAAAGAWVGGQRGLLLGAVTFTVLVAVLVASAAAASSEIEPTLRASASTIPGPQPWSLP